MDSNHNIRLTSSEISNLWTNYMNDAIAICMLKHFQETVKDMQIKPLIEFSLEISEKHITKITEIFEKENHPIPIGYTDQDINHKAPALFGDSFYLHYIKQMARIGLTAYGMSLGLAAREDIRNIYNEWLKDATELDNQATNLLLHKGLYVRAPFISIPSKTEFVKRQTFLGDLMGKEHRPLLAIEVSHLYANIQTNALGKALVMGFSQVAKSNKVREFMVEGRDLASKHIGILGEFLNNSELKVPMTWDDTVTNSTVSPFSDRLMMAHVAQVISVGMADYGASLAISARKDVVAAYGRLMAEIGLYAGEGAQMMIDNEWMEQPPQADDRNALAGV
ncbi:DUF3231 family protein [Ammoniphilus sp. CFH 90114]|uniref:DUF3231 family protein n=1 Tax=Ammoniphilus sp. CFH 90114 TaxID=2493665 RepID=UPI00100FF74D|nr:DUF3231 family protein [Ammoniphilus sp. CFH 90114]RXT15473.1 DUF3231 family protein [Ammoniphilus sp. CFH 90114]